MLQVTGKKFPHIKKPAAIRQTFWSQARNRTNSSRQQPSAEKNSESLSRDLHQCYLPVHTKKTASPSQLLLKFQVFASGFLQRIFRTIASSRRRGGGNPSFQGFHFLRHGISVPFGCKGSLAFSNNSPLFVFASATFQNVERNFPFLKTLPGSVY